MVDATRRVLCGVMVLLSAVLIVFCLPGVPPAHAATLSWDGNGAVPPSGNFGVANNWNPNTAPGSADTAQFGLGGGVSYTVRFPGSGTLGFNPVSYATDRLIVTSTNSVTFSEASAFSSYSVTNSSIGESNRGVIIGSQAGDNATLTSTLSGLTGFTAVAATIADAAGSQGTLNINDGFFSLSGGGNNALGLVNVLFIGSMGSGALNITSGGTVTLTGDSASSVLGFFSSSVGIVTVSGSNSIWNSSGADGLLLIGDDGTGTLNVSAGGQVISAGCDIAYGLSSVSTATVDGSASQWTENGTLIVGAFGNGTLNITGGALVANLITQVEEGQISIGDQAGSHGTINVTGTGSTLTGAEMSVGNSGNGTLSILAGGQVSMAGTFIAQLPGSVGTVNISGSGSKFTAASDPFGMYPNLDIGEQGTGTLNITAGGQLVSGGGNIIGGSPTSLGFVNVDGAGSSWSDGGTLIIGSSGGGTLNISNAGQVSNTSADLAAGAGSAGTVTVDGAGSKWTNSSTLVVGDKGLGTLNIVNGGQVTNTTAMLGKNSVAIGLATVDGAGSTWTNSGDLTVGVAGSATLTVRNGGTVSVTGLLSIGTTGTLHGNSTIAGNVQNGGLVAPGASSGLGASAGALHINGNFTQTAGGDLQIELGGTSAGAQYDQLLVSNALSLAGKLDVSLINGFLPKAGNSFNILAWGTLSGTFASGVQLPNMNGRIVWDSSQLDTTGVLSVASTYYAGDINRDGQVTVADVPALLVALSNFNAYLLANPALQGNATLLKDVVDVNGDGNINNADIQALITLLANNPPGGAGNGAVTAVPEPPTLALCVMGLSVLAIRCRRELLPPGW